MQKKERGFTLIELIVVIIILGILGAVALPRFVDLQVQARQSKLNGAVGAVRAGAALYHAQCLAALASSTPPSNNCTSLSMEGLSVTGIGQYPTADAAGIVAVAGLNVAAAGGDYTSANGGSSAGDTITIAVPTPTSGSCQFSYKAATVSGTQLLAAPVVSMSGTTACN